MSCGPAELLQNSTETNDCTAAKNMRGVSSETIFFFLSLFYSRVFLFFPCFLPFPPFLSFRVRPPLGFSCADPDDDDDNDDIARCHPSMRESEGR